MTDATVEIVLCATDAERVAALEMLFSLHADDECAARVAQALQSAATGTLDLSRLWIARHGDSIVGATLGMRQADGVYLVWPPMATNGPHEASAVSLLWETLVHDVSQASVRLAQVLLSREETQHDSWLLRHGFARAADLYFLACVVPDVAATWPSPNKGVPAEAFTWEEYADGDQAERFAQLIDATYVDSLDVPLLAGWRTGREALVSHRLSGEFTPRLWRLLRCGGNDAAVLLLAPHRDQQALEIVYMGVAPKFRRRGWGRGLVQAALAAARNEQCGVVFLAVDAANFPAIAAYRTAGFTELAQRVVWLRFGANPRGE